MFRGDAVSLELNYFYLYLKRYLEEKYAIRVERGDTNVLTRELLAKISDRIAEATFLIADVTGNNANVFFELGIAHEKNKPVIFLTQDDPKDAPVDIRQFEFIRYELARHEDFLSKLDNAVRNVLGAGIDIQRLYELARGVLREFDKATGVTHAQISREEFHQRMIQVITEAVPAAEERIGMERFLLPRILRDPTDFNVMQRVAGWLEGRGPAAGS